MNRSRPEHSGGPGSVYEATPGGLSGTGPPLPASLGGTDPSEPLPRRREFSVHVPDHTLLRIVGRGAYGEVWLARSSLGTPRAVKVIRLADFADARPFEREFRGIQKYEPESRGHEGLIDILQVGRNEPEGYFYYVMELADPVRGDAGELPAALSPRESSGSSETAPARSTAFPSACELDSSAAGYEPRTLRHELKTRGRLSVAECLHLGLTIAGAVERLHSAGLVHRDIKPSNIIFVGGLPKLADIGLIANVGDTHSIVGTEGYLPPEGAGSPEADVYGLGKVLYEMSTGLDQRRFPELPQETGDPREAIPLREINEIVLKACARDPARRYPTATALRLDLERLQRGQSILQRRRWESARRRLRHLVPTLALLAILLAVVRPFTVQRRAALPVATEDRASVFVLPFRVTGSVDAALADLPDRMTDAFIDGLASIEGVRRSPRRSGWITRDEAELRHSLEQTNDMRHILSGELAAHEGTLVLRLRLHERAVDRLVWEEAFTGTHRAVIPMERQALDRLATVLGIRVTEAESSRWDRILEGNAEAGRLVLEGWRQYAQNAGVHTGYTAILALSERARQIDPACLDARFLRGGILRDMALLCRSPTEAWPEVIREMSAILEVDETHRAALNQMAGGLLCRNWDWVGFDTYLQRQLSLEAGNGHHFIRALWLRTHGLPEARREQELAERDGSADLAILIHGAAARWVHREYDEGIRILERAQRLHPEAVWPYFWFAQLHAARGTYEHALEAINRYERASQVPMLTALRGYAFARMGQTAKARLVIDDLAALERSLPYIPSYCVARVHAALGDREKALEWLEKAESEGSEFLVFADIGGLRTDPAWDDLQEHPRFKALLRKVGLGQWPVPIHPLP